jgi:hypothetical protein
MEEVIAPAALLLGRIPPEDVTARRRDVTIDAVDGRHGVRVSRASDEGLVFGRSARPVAAGLFGLK